MFWARGLDYEDLLEGDLRLIYETCGEEVLLQLLDRLAGNQLYLNAKPVAEMKRRYIQQHTGTASVKELSVRLDVSREFVYDVLRPDGDGD